MNKILVIVLSLALVASAAGASDFDYSRGILIINEDWYGHQNSSINYLDPYNTDGEYWRYRIIREENPGMELGCTNQYGALWNGRLYCIAKQEKDPGASITGGRITVVDAYTMKIIHQQVLIDPTGAQCDGRAFVGVNEHKGYVSTSNGIWIFNLDSYEIKGKIEGSDNPFAGGDNDKPNTDPTGSLYYGQTGVMILSEGRVFAAHQQYGLLVIDTETDKVVEVISMDMVEEKAGIGSLVQSKDGNIWCSVAKNTQGLGNALNYLVKVDPKTLEYEIIKLPEGILGPLNSWYAWTPDAFVASRRENSLFWKGGVNTWFSGVWIYKFNIDLNEFSLFIDLQKDPQDWKLYGCSLGINPETDELYMSLFHQFGKPEYLVRRYSPEGKIIKEYPMIENYWFPSIMIFLNENSETGVEKIHIETPSIELSGDNLLCRNCRGEKIEVFSINGRKVTAFMPRSDYEKFVIDLPKGIYILKAARFAKKIIL